MLLPPSRILLTTGQLVVFIGIYGVAWVGAVLVRIRSTTQSYRAFAKGMLIALLVTGGLGLCSWIGVLPAQASAE
jgi:hypothetical protein